MATYKTYNITDTLNDVLDEASLDAACRSDSTIKDIFDGINRNQGSSTFELHLSENYTSAHETAMDALVSSHDGTPLPEEIQSVRSEAFANKAQLFFRGQGVKVNCVAGQTTNISFTIPYAKAKLNGIEILYGQDKDTCQFKVLDSTTGTYTTIPNYVLNQFGYDWNVDHNAMKEILPYDADVFIGMQLCVEYTNNGGSDVEVGVNFYIHEDKS